MGGEIWREAGCVAGWASTLTARSPTECHGAKLQARESRKVEAVPTHPPTTRLLRSPRQSFLSVHPALPPSRRLCGAAQCRTSATKPRGPPRNDETCFRVPHGHVSASLQTGSLYSLKASELSRIRHAAVALNALSYCDVDITLSTCNIVSRAYPLPPRTRTRTRTRSQRRHGPAGPAAVDRLFCR